MRRLVVTCLTGSVLLTGCGNVGGSTGDPLQVSNDLHAATPASAPPTQRAPTGTVLPAPPVQLTAFDTATNSLVLAHDHTLTLRAADHPERTTRSIDLPSTPAALRPAGDATLLAALPDTNQVLSIDLRTGATTPTPVPGGPVDALPFGDQLAVAQRDSHTVALLDHGRITRTVSGFAGPAQLFDVGGSLHVLDRLTTALTPIDTRTGEKGAGLRAGEGATNAVTDRYGRILALDTRGNEFLAFSTNPLIMKQRYPLEAAPYGLAYDPGHDLAWTTLTATNEIVGYDIAGGEPQERHRLSTVRQPNAASVDPRTGTVYIASATGDGIQVVHP